MSSTLRVFRILCGVTSLVAVAYVGGSFAALPEAVAASVKESCWGQYKVP